jgi:hypothetical protein
MSAQSGGYNQNIYSHVKDDPYNSILNLVNSQETVIGRNKKLVGMKHEVGPIERFHRMRIGGCGKRCENKQNITFLVVLRQER